MIAPAPADGQCQFMRRIIIAIAAAAALGAGANPALAQQGGAGGYGSSPSMGNNPGGTVNPGTPAEPGGSPLGTTPGLVPPPSNPYPQRVAPQPQPLQNPAVPGSPNGLNPGMQPTNPAAPGQPGGSPLPGAGTSQP